MLVLPIIRDEKVIGVINLESPEFNFFTEEDAAFISILIQEEVSCESDVIVQADDWLSKIAEKAFGDVLTFPAIAEATNVMAGLKPDVLLINSKSITPPSTAVGSTWPKLS